MAFIQVCRSFLIKKRAVLFNVVLRKKDLCAIFIKWYFFPEFHNRGGSMRETKNLPAWRIAGFMLKVLISAAIIGCIIFFHRDELIAACRKFSAPILIFALPAALIPLLTGAYRWQQLAAVAGLQLRFREAFSLTMQGNFFSLVIPAGAVGGDLVKISMVSRRSGSGRKIDGALTILMDRLIGMLALFALGLAVLPCALPLLRKLFADKDMGVTATLVFAGVCLAGIGGGAAVFAHRKILQLPLLNKIFTFADNKCTGAFSRMCAAIDLYTGAPRTVVLQLLNSLLLIHLVPVAVMALTFYGFGLPILWQSLLPAVVLGNIAGLIPLFPGGIGGRDMTVIALLTAGGTPPGEAAAAQLCCTVITLFFTLLLGGDIGCAPGGIKVIRYGNAAVKIGE